MIFQLDENDSFDEDQREALQPYLGQEVTFELTLKLISLGFPVVLQLDTRDGNIGIDHPYGW